MVVHRDIFHRGADLADCADCLGAAAQSEAPQQDEAGSYECGIETVGDAWVQFKVQYYLYALVFLIFDIEMLFLFPWAVAYNQLGLFALIAMAGFIGILGVALIYAWRKGALEWL